MRTDELNPLEKAPLEAGMRLLLRLDLNVPCLNGKVVNDYRIKRAQKTIELLERNKCRTTIISHIESEEKTLVPIFEYLKSRHDVSFAKSVSEAKSAEIAEGGFLLVENIRDNPGETINDPEFSKELSELGEIYISDAFAVMHRKHSSVTGVAQLLPSYAGFLVMEEVENLSLAFNPPRPALFILGGAKFETKMPLVTKFVDSYDKLFLGGALANDVFKTKGINVGQSLVSDSQTDFKSIASNGKISLPRDFIVKENEKIIYCGIDSVGSGRIVDAGKETVAFLRDLIAEAKFILWNGPLGEYENGFSESTDELTRILAESEAQSIIGGGDTVASVEKLGLLEKFSFVSTGGGAMLDFLSNENLPGLEVLRKK